MLDQHLGLGLALGGDLVPRSLALRGRGLPTVRGGLALRSLVLGGLMLEIGRAHV